MMPVQARLLGLCGAVAVLGIACAMAYDAGNRHGTNAVLVRTQASALAAVNQRLEENETARLLLEDQAKKASIAHEQELQAIRDRAVRTAGQRVPVNRALFCPPAGTAEAAPAGSAGQADAGAVFLPEPFAADLRQLVDQAAEVAADLRDLKTRSAACFE